jgi:hypothetical protein
MGFPRAGKAEEQRILGTVGEVATGQLDFPRFSGQVKTIH